MSPQRTTCKLGEGGMGEIWRATDTKLNCEVAEQIVAGPIPLDEALPIAKQIDVSDDLTRLAAELRLAADRAPRMAMWLKEWARAAAQFRTGTGEL